MTVKDLVPVVSACERLVLACGGKLPGDTIFAWHKRAEDHPWRLVISSKQVGGIRVPAPTVEELGRWYEGKGLTVEFLHEGAIVYCNIVHLKNRKYYEGVVAVGAVCDAVTDMIMTGWLPKP